MTEKKRQYYCNDFLKGFTILTKILLSEKPIWKGHILGSNHSMVPTIWLSGKGRTM